MTLLRSLFLVPFLACLADDNPGSMIITKVNMPALGDDDNDPFACDISSGETALGAGSVDVLLAQYSELLGQVMSYWAHLNVKSILTGGTEAFIALQGFEVDFEYPYNAGEPGYNGEVAALVQNVGGFFLPYAGGIDPGATITAGFVTFLPGELLFALAEEFGGPTDRMLSPFILLVHVRAIGDRSTIRVESNTLDFPVYVCKGCQTLGVTPDVLDCDSTSTGLLYRGDPCSGFPLNSFVTCCWDESNGEDVLRCPHPSALE